MKNQTKRKKIKPMQPNEWFIMSRQPILVSDLKGLFDPQADIEIWPELGVLEIVMGEKSSMDIEMIETDLGDEYSNAYLQEHQIQALFTATFRPEDYDSAVITDLSVAKQYLNEGLTIINNYYILF